MHEGKAAIYAARRANAHPIWNDYIAEALIFIQGKLTLYEEIKCFIYHNANNKTSPNLVDSGCCYFLLHFKAWRYH